jgi:hypothetical protein
LRSKAFGQRIDRKFICFEYGEEDIKRQPFISFVLTVGGFFDTLKRCRKNPAPLIKYD